MSALSPALALVLALSPPAGRVIAGPPTRVDDADSREALGEASSLLALQPAAPAPGGYWRFGEQSVPEPPDGHDSLTIGSVVFSLGLIRAGAGGVSVYLSTRPDVCKESCRNMYAYGWSGVGFGGLMVLTGAVMVIIGAAQQAKHRRWERGEARTTVGPWMGERRSLGLAVDLRF